MALTVTERSFYLVAIHRNFSLGTNLIFLRESAFFAVFFVIFFLRSGQFFDISRQYFILFFFKGRDMIDVRWEHSIEYSQKIGRFLRKIPQKITKCT